MHARGRRQASQVIRDEIMYRVEGRRRGVPFVAGAIARNGIVVRTAPILHSLRLRSIWEAEDMCRRAGWTWELNARAIARAIAADQAESEDPGIC